MVSPNHVSSNSALRDSNNNNNNFINVSRNVAEGRSPLY